MILFILFSISKCFSLAPQNQLGQLENWMQSGLPTISQGLESDSAVSIGVVGESSPVESEVHGQGLQSDSGVSIGVVGESSPVEDVGSSIDEQLDIEENERTSLKGFDDVPAEVLEQLRQDNKLGAGQYGQVYRMIIDSKVVAVKVIKRHTGDDNEVWNEVDMMNRLQGNDMTVDILGAYKDPNRYFLVMDFVEGESLGVMLRKERNAFFNKREFFMVGESLINFMQWTLNKGVTPRDLKPDNIMLRGHEIDAMVFIDYGLFGFDVDLQGYVEALEVFLENMSEDIGIQSDELTGTGIFSEMLLDLRNNSSKNITVFSERLNYWHQIFREKIEQASSLSDIQTRSLSEEHEDFIVDGRAVDFKELEDDFPIVVYGFYDRITGENIAEVEFFREGRDLEMSEVLFENGSFDMVELSASFSSYRVERELRKKQRKDAQGKVTSLLLGLTYDHSGFLEDKESADSWREGLESRTGEMLSTLGREHLGSRNVEVRLVKPNKGKSLVYNRLEERRAVLYVDERLYFAIEEWAPGEKNQEQREFMYNIILENEIRQIFLKIKAQEAEIELTENDLSRLELVSWAQTMMSKDKKYSEYQDLFQSFLSFITETDPKEAEDFNRLFEWLDMMRGMSSQEMKIFTQTYNLEENFSRMDKAVPGRLTDDLLASVTVLRSA